jgi:hypothetical protein
MDHNEYLAALAQNVLDLIDEAELLFDKKRWARAAGLAMCAGEQAIQYDRHKHDPNAAIIKDHGVIGGIWNRHDIAATLSAKATMTGIIFNMEAQAGSVANEIDKKWERREWYIEQGIDPTADIPDFERNLPNQRIRAFYTNRDRNGPALWDEPQARAWIDRAKAIAKTAQIPGCC